MRGGRRRRAAGGQGHRPGQAHRLASSSTPAPATAARASRRTPSPWCARPATTARPVRLIETTVAVNDARKKAMAAQGRRRPGGRRSGSRGPGRQDHRRAGPDLQAQHRRHARRPQPGHRAGPAGHGRQGPGLRSGGPPRGARSC